MKTRRKIPPIGARIIKSSVSVALCMVIYYLRTLLPAGNGIPFYSALAALWCLQPYHDTARINAGQRSVGTFVGALFGLWFLVILKAAGVHTPIILYLIASAVVIPVIYLTVLLDKRNASFFSCVVFLSIALTHSFDDDPYIFVLNRVLDTFIGIGVGLAVNNLRLPLKHDSDTLYVSGIDSVLIPDNESAVNYSKVELNRLIRSGVRFTISTIHTPAVVMSLMKGVDLRLPIIVMDGAAIYDIREKEYIEAEYLPSSVSDTAESIIAEQGYHCFVNVMYDSTLLIFYGDFNNEAEREIFLSFKHSPYRNYIHSACRHFDEYEKILYLTVLETDDNVCALEKELKAQLGGSVRITISESGYEGYKYLKVLSPLASKQHMLTKLKAHTNADRVVTFGSIKGEYDVYIGDGGGNATVKKLKKLCRNEIYR